MLAYRFWHWKRDEAGAAAYEDALAGFHASLAAAPPPGHRGSASFAIDGALWTVPGARERVPTGASAAGAPVVYEDWYVVGGMSDLDPLEEAAIGLRHRAAHDASAVLAAGGQAGLYRLFAGDLLPAGAAHALWFGKPAGMSYDALRDLLAGREGTSVWCRKMVLGPAPEFCYLSEGSPELPAAIADTVPVRLRRVWPR